MTDEEIIEQQNAYYMAGYPSRRSEKEVEKHKWNNIFLEDCAGYDKKIAEEYSTLQERIEKLEKENAELKMKIYGGGYEMIITKKDADINLLEKQLKEQKEQNKNYEQLIDNGSVTLVKERLKNYKQLTKAKEHIRTLISCLIDWVQEGDKDYCYIADAEQFLKEIEK